MKREYDPLDEAVDIKKLIDAIYFAEEDVASANLEQAKLMYTVARYRVQLMRRRVRAEATMKLVRSRASYKYRKKNRGGRPLTEGAVRDRLSLNSDVLEAEKKLDQVSVDEELAKQLFEVFKQRQGAINNIVKSRGNDIARELWVLEHSSKHKKLKEASRVIRGKYRSKESESED